LPAGGVDKQAHARKLFAGMRIHRALVSVYDKEGIVPFVRRLHELGVEIVSTGGTAALLKDEGIPHVEVEKYTGFPEMLSGRVKTLHPKVHGGLLYLRNNPDHRREVEANGILPIDLVVVNLYPFQATVEHPGITREEALEKIDIGGPAMLRSAAKNYQDVTVVTDPRDYPVVLKQMEEHDGATTLKLREQLAIKVFQLQCLPHAALRRRAHPHSHADRPRQR
jgi:phosphoribosylaminoimidazolecarboxamide formyltransferase / IMP cyclohydrolase